MHAIDHRQTFERFKAQTLPKTEWTHEAHLTVCWYALQDRRPAAATAYLRGAISSYNESVGTANTPSSGYHETLTRYFVNAVHAIGAAEPEALFDDPRCTRHAPSAHWSSDRLFSVGGRLGWTEPDLAPLWWRTSTAADDDHHLVDACAGELELLLPSVRADAHSLDRLLHPDFSEIGASGRRWSRDEIIADLVATAEPVTASVDELVAVRLDVSTILITYRTSHPGRTARRSSIWARSDVGWQARFHQGTPRLDPAP